MAKYLTVCARIAAAAVMTQAACSLSAGPDPDGDISVLFVGNSLTYFNDLPRILEAMADSAGGPTLRASAVAFPDYALEDHWQQGAALAEISRGGWDVVVLQQGPSSVEANRANLREMTVKFAAEIRKAGAVPALYSVWPTSDRRIDFDRAIESYTLAARDVDGILFPVASAWLKAWEVFPQLGLYAADGLHPSVAGSYLAAAVMYKALFAKSPVGLPPALALPGGIVRSVSPGVALILQQAADQVTTGVGIAAAASAVR